MACVKVTFICAFIALFDQLVCSTINHAQRRHLETRPMLDHPTVTGCLDNADPKQCIPREIESTFPTNQSIN